MRCACCDKPLDSSEIKYNKLLKRWDYCFTCKTISREILAEYDWMAELGFVEGDKDNNDFFLDKHLDPVYNIGVGNDDT